MKFKTGDRVFFFIVLTLALMGFAIFSSAALGLLARETASVSRDIIVQAGFGFGLGLLAFFIARAFSLTTLKKYALHFYAFALALTALVFVPGIGLHAGGATRW